MRILSRIRKRKESLYRVNKRTISQEKKNIEAKRGHCLVLLQAEDLLDDILSFEAGSLGDSLGKDGQSDSLTDLSIKPEPLLLTDAEIHALAKDRQKKDNHNMSEYIMYIFGFLT